MPNPGTERSQVFTDRNAQIMFLNSATRYSTVRLWIFPKKFLDQEQVVVKNHYINHRPFLRDVREDERNRLTFILQFNSNFHEGLNCDLNHLNLKIAFLQSCFSFFARTKTVYLSVCLSVYGTASAEGPCFGAGSTPMLRLFVWSGNAHQPENTNIDSVAHF